MSFEVWPLAGFFAAALALVLGIVLLAGFFPASGLPQSQRTLAWRGLVWLNLPLLMGLLIAALVLAGNRLAWPAGVIAGGLAILLAPMLFQIMPPGWRNGRSGLLGQALLSSALMLLLLSLDRG